MIQTGRSEAWTDIHRSYLHNLLSVQPLSWSGLGSDQLFNTVQDMTS